MTKYLLFILLCWPWGETLWAQARDTLVASPIKEIVVRGSVKPLDSRMQPYTTSIISHPNIERDNRHSLLPTLSEQVPGLFVTARSNMGYGVSGGAAGGISIRGIGSSPTTGVAILVDGQPQYMSIMGHPIADMALATLAERVEVVRGPASAMYGSGAMGGVINIITRKAPQQGAAANLNISYGSLNTLRSSLTTMLHKSSVEATISGNYDRTDSHRANMGFEQYGGSAKVSIAMGERWDIAANINLTHFNAANPGTIDAPIIGNHSHITRMGSMLSLQHHAAPLSGTINIIYNYGHHNIYDGYASGEPAPEYRFISDDTTLGVSLVEKLQMGRTQLLVGVDYRHYGGRAENRPIEHEQSLLLAQRHQDNIGSYININQPVGRRLAFNAALRLDYNTSHKAEWVPQAGITLQTGRNSHLKAMVSKGFRYPTIREMYMFPSQNPHLRPERLINYEIAFSHTLRIARYALNIFYINGDNTIQTAMVDGRPQNINSGHIENYGFEAELALTPAEGWQINVNYTLLKMRYRILAAPQHKLYISASYSKPKWNIGTSIQYIAGLTTQIEPPLQECYTLWNAYTEFHLSRHCTIFARAENILAERYEINAGFPMPRTTINTGIKIKL